MQGLSAEEKSRQVDDEWQAQLDKDDWVDALSMTAAAATQIQWEEDSIVKTAKMFYRLIKQGPESSELVTIPRQLLSDLRECARRSGASNELRDQANRALGDY